MRRILYVFIACCLLSCATTKTEHEQTTHVVGTDTAATETSHSGQVTQQTVNIDSIVNAVWQRTQQEMARQEQEHETVTETLTETIDSLGRVVRQSQKTTDRTVSREERQRIDRLEQTMEIEISSAITEYDSLWQDRFSRYQATMTDSLAAIRDLQKQTSASNPITWWQSIRMWIGNIALVAIVILVFVWILRKKFHV